MNKLIIILGILLIIFGGYFYYKFGVKPASQMKTNGSQVIIGPHTFDVEVVTSETDQEIGLTKYNSIANNQGMLFLFPQPGFYSFWMKGMKFPLDMVFIHDDIIVSFVENATPASVNDANPQIYRPESSANKVLEMNSGLIKNDAIKKGDRVKFIIK